MIEERHDNQYDRHNTVAIDQRQQPPICILFLFDKAGLKLRKLCDYDITQTEHKKICHIQEHRIWLSVKNSCNQIADECNCICQHHCDKNPAPPVENSLHDNIADEKHSRYHKRKAFC